MKNLYFKIQGNLIKELRKKARLSQGALAKKTGIHLQQISNTERGVARLPPQRAKRLAYALNSTIARIAAAAAKDFKARYISIAEGKK